MHTREVFLNDEWQQVSDGVHTIYLERRHGITGGTVLFNLSQDKPTIETGHTLVNPVIISNKLTVWCRAEDGYCGVIVSGWD